MSTWEIAGIEGDDEAAFEEIVLNGRMCIVSRQSLPAEALIRFVADPDGQVVADLKRKLPGRGAHVEAKRSSVALAVKRNLFRRALKSDVRAGDELADEVDAMLARSVLGSLGLARKAGQLVSGAAKVEAQVRSGRAAALVQASDAASDGLRKMDGARHAAEAAGRKAGLPVFRLFTADELGLALGGVNVVHAAVLAGDAGSAVLKRLTALENYRDGSPASISGRADGARHREIEPTNDEGHPSKDARGTDCGRGISPAQEAEA